MRRGSLDLDELFESNLAVHENSYRGINSEGHIKGFV